MNKPDSGQIDGLGESGNVVTLTGDIYTYGELRPEFVDAVRRLEKEIDRRVWLLVHGLDPNLPYPKFPMEGIGMEVLGAMLHARRKLPSERIAILMDSPGGDAEAAYRLALALQRVCGGFDIYIPRWAKSAATLLSFGAERIFLGPFAELGPLDVQHKESRRKDLQSALNESQAIDRLHVQSLKAFDQTMGVLADRLGLKGEELDEFVPVALDFAAKQFSPLFEKVDVVHWTKVSRLLRIGQDYATRLLQKRYEQGEAERIAHTIVETYPDHSFMVDDDEANDIGLSIENPEGNLEGIFEDLFDCLNVEPFTAIGFLKEATDDELVES